MEIISRIKSMVKVSFNGPVAISMRANILKMRDMVRER